MREDDVRMRVEHIDLGLEVAGVHHVVVVEDADVRSSTER